MRKAVIMSGVSGAGKGTYIITKFPTALVVSADNYFMSDGEYKFDPSKLSSAHGACFHDFICALQEKYSLVVVDNTNTTSVEVSPYILGAQAFGYETEIITIMCKSEDDIKACAARNTHNVPFHGVLRQHTNLKMRQLMPWWNNTVIYPQF